MWVHENTGTRGDDDGDDDDDANDGSDPPLRLLPRLKLVAAQVYEVEGMVTSSSTRLLRFFLVSVR